MLKDKTLAILGVVSYILIVLSSASDLEGNFLAPIALIVASGIAGIVFVIMATIRLWKILKTASILLASSSVIHLIFEVGQVVTSPSYGSPIIILSNIIGVIRFIAFFWAVFLLWAMAKQAKER